MQEFLREVSAAVRPFAEKELQKLLDERYMGGQMYVCMYVCMYVRDIAFLSAL